MQWVTTINHHEHDDDSRYLAWASTWLERNNNETESDTNNG